MRTAIVTDSSSGICRDRSRGNDIFIIPIPVIIAGKTFFEGVNLTYADLLQALSAHKPVSISQPTLSEMITVWNYVLDLGYDELLYIPMSSGLSDTYRMAQNLKMDYGCRVEIVDNHRISISLQHAVLDAIDLRKVGYPASQIRKMLEKTAAQSIAYVGIGTSGYLNMTMGVPSIATEIRNIVKMKPWMVYEDEFQDAYAKIKRIRDYQNRLVKELYEKVTKFHKEGFSVRIGVTGSFISEEATRKWIEMVQQAFPEEDVCNVPLAASICCHVGLDAFAIGASRILF